MGNIVLILFGESSAMIEKMNPIHFEAAQNLRPAR